MGLRVGEVKLERWNPKWQEDFETEKRNLLDIFNKLALDIQHIGSTSVEGLDAKPIIDIAVGVNELSDFEKVRNRFEKFPGYSIKLNNAPNEILIRKGPEENRTHFIHIMEQDSERFQSSIRFRNLLRNSPEIRNEYASLKHELAERLPYNRKSYTASKNDFIQEKLMLMSPNALKKSLAKCYTKDLCYPKIAQHWSKKNPCFGMCAITALVVNDLYGGKIGKIHVDSVSHYFNIINNEIVDFTASQFEQSVEYLSHDLADRDVMLSNTDTKLRYGMLKDRISKIAHQ